MGDGIGGCDLRRWSDELKRGDHVAHLYRSDIEQARVLLELLRWLEEDEKLVLLTDGWERPVFRHPVLDTALEDGRLAVLPARSTFCSTGRFNPDAALDLLLLELDQAREEGFSGTAMVWDGNWALSVPEAAGPFIAFGAQLALAPLPSDLTLICQYDVRAFPPEQVELQRRLHPLVLEEGRLDRNFWVVSTSSFGARARTARTERARSGAVAQNIK